MWEGERVNWFWVQGILSKRHVSGLEISIKMSVSSISLRATSNRFVFNSKSDILYFIYYFFCLSIFFGGRSFNFYNYYGFVLFWAWQLWKVEEINIKMSVSSISLKATSNRFVFNSKFDFFFFFFLVFQFFFGGKSFNFYNY